jgi:hypothetical protein
MALFTQCFFCGGGARWKETCPMCGGAGVVPIGFEDAADLVDKISDTLILCLRRRGPDNVADALADAHPQLVSLVLRWR